MTVHWLVVSAYFVSGLIAGRTIAYRTRKVVGECVSLEGTNDGHVLMRFEQYGINVKLGADDGLKLGAALFKCAGWAKAKVTHG